MSVPSHPVHPAPPSPCNLLLQPVTGHQNKGRVYPWAQSLVPEWPVLLMIGYHALFGLPSSAECVCTGLKLPSGPFWCTRSTPTASVRAPIACERGLHSPARLTGSLCQEKPPGPTHVLIRILPQLQPPNVSQLLKFDCFPISLFLSNILFTIYLSCLI